MASKVKSSSLFISPTGIFENLQYFIFIYILASIVCFILTIFIYKFFFIRVNNLKIERKNFYECGFKPSLQRPLQMSLQFYMISILFILFDTDLLFLYPLVSGFTFFFLIDLMLILFILFTIYISIVYEKINFSFFWKFIMLQLFIFIKIITIITSTTFNIQNYIIIILVFMAIFNLNINTFGLFNIFFKINLFKICNFVKESFFIDFLQKKIIDNFFKKSLIISTQIFNLNYFSMIIIKYIYSVFLNNFNFFQKINDFNLINILLKLIMIFYFILILIINIVFFF